MRKLNLVASNYPILIVEDDVAACDSIAYYLEMLGFCVHKAYSRQDGYDKYLQHRPQMIITDIEMPDGNGLDMVEKIREHDKECAIFVVTGYATNDHLLHAAKLKLEDIILKPLTSKKIQCAITAFFESIKKQQAVLNQATSTLYSFENQCIYEADKRVTLTHMEILLLELLLQNNEKVVTYETIEYNIYKAPATRNAIKSLVQKLKLKIGGATIESAPSIGYRLICSR